MNEIIITPLGTVSPYSKESHNCPGFLIEYQEEKVLLDCGNGITRLLNFPKDLQNLHIIITQYHNDHFGDLSSLQYASLVYHNLGLLNKKIKIYLPKEEFRKMKEGIKSIKETYSEYYDIRENQKYHIKDLTITFENNHSHSIPSYMVKIENKKLKIVYTSDIGVTNKKGLIEFCMNADLIICESSFLRKHESSSTTHFTAFEAGLLAKQAKANSLLLTHFWPEENRNLYLEEARINFENTHIAEENQRLVLRKGKLK